MYKPPEATRHHKSMKLLILLPLRADLLCTLQYETPCTYSIILGPKWGNKNGLTLPSQFFLFISDGLGGVWGIKKRARAYVAQSIFAG